MPQRSGTRSLTTSGDRPPSHGRRVIATLTMHLHLPACSSLKEKRGRIKPLIARLHREFNVSAAEIDFQDSWQEALIACGMVGNERAHLEQSLRAVATWVSARWPDGMIVQERIEVI